MPRGRPTLRNSGGGLLRDLAALVGFFPELCLRPDSLDAVPTELLDNATAFGDVRMEAEEVDAVPQRKDAGLLVQLQAPAIHQGADVLEDLFQPLFVRENDIEVIHVPP